MADVTLKKEAFERFKLVLPRKAKRSEEELPLTSSRQRLGIHWGVSAKDLWIHIEMTKDILSDESSTLTFEYPKDDQKFMLTYNKGTKKSPLYGYSHILDTYVYDYIVPALDFKDAHLNLSAIFPVVLH